MFSVSRFDPGTAPVDEETTQLEATQQSERRTKRKRQQQQDDVAAAPTAADDDADHMMITDAATEQQAADAKAAKKAASRKSKKSKSATATEPVAAAEPQLSEAASVLPARAIKKLKSLDDSAARLALEQAEVEKQQRKAEKTALKRSKQQRRHEELAVEAAQRHAAQAEQQARLNAQAAKSEAIARAMQLKSMPVSVLPDVLNTTKPIAAAATTTLAPATATAGKRSVPPVTLNAIDSVAPLIHTPGMSLTAASIVSKGQKAKDPEERAHERKMRKRARLIKQAEDEGLPVPTFSDDDAEAEVETAPAPPQLDALSMIKQVTDATVAEIAASHSTRALPFHAAVAKMHAAAASAAATKPQLVVEGGEDNNAVADSTPTAAIPTAQSEAKLARQLALTAAQPLWMQHGTQIDNGQAPTPVEQLQLLDPMIRQTLTQSMQIHSLFPMQLAAMQTILRTHATNDVCCNFATGSGKTLAYVLPIIHSLSQRIVPRLRCLVIVPSRDLALQVQLVFKQFAQHSANQLRIGCAIGQHSFTQEQQDFVQLQLQQQQQSLDDASGMPRQYESLIDVLVSTPGRLMDHLQQTAGFTLIHLQWIVLDEIDRLLNQDYASWMSQVEQACKSSSTTTASWHQNASATSSSAASSSSLSAIQLRPAPCRVQKLLFSATLSTDPGKLAALHLHHPLLLAASLSASNPFTLPASLSQHLIACEPSEKPLVLLWLLARARLDTMKDMRKVIVFTASLESTHRLTRLLQLYFNQSDNDNSAAASIGKVSVHEFSSLISQHARTKLLNKFKTTPLADTNSNSCQVMVCSDAFSRGVDVPFVDYGQLLCRTSCVCVCVCV